MHICFIYILSKMLSSFLGALLKLSNTTSLQKLSLSDYIAKYKAGKQFETHVLSENYLYLPLQRRRMGRRKRKKMSGTRLPLKHIRLSTHKSLQECPVQVVLQSLISTQRTLAKIYCQFPKSFVVFLKNVTYFL